MDDGQQQEEEKENEGEEFAAQGAGTAEEKGGSDDLPLDGESNPMNTLFPQAGEQSQQVLISVLQTLMRQAGVNM